MSWLIFSVCQIIETWLDSSSIVVAFMRFTMKRSRSGLMVRSSIENRLPTGNDKKKPARSRFERVLANSEGQRQNLRDNSLCRQAPTAFAGMMGDFRHRFRPCTLDSHAKR
jgi:hypothetical protein